MLKFLHSVNLTLSDNSKAHFLNSLGAESNRGVVEAVKQGHDLKITVDNIDGRMVANQVN